MDQPAVGARLADKRRIDSGADPDQDTGLILTPVLKREEGTSAVIYSFACKFTQMGLTQAMLRSFWMTR